MGMKIGTKNSNLDASMSGTGGRNETVDFRRLEGHERRRVEVKEHVGLRLGFLHGNYGMSNLRGGYGVRGTRNRRSSLGELEGVQNLVQGLIEIRYGDFGLFINAGDKVRRSSKRVERRPWR